MAFCTVCGSQLDDGARFCVKCGRPVASEMSVAQSIPVSPAVAVAIPAPVPEATPLPLPIVVSPYAGFWLRVLASLIDSAILGIPFAAIMATSFFAFGGVALLKGLKVGPGEMWMRPTRRVWLRPSFPFTAQRSWEFSSCRGFITPRWKALRARELSGRLSWACV